MTLGGIYDYGRGTCSIVLTFSQNVISDEGTDQILDNENLSVVRNTWVFNFTCDILTQYISFMTLIQKTSEELRNKIIRRMQNKGKESNEYS